MMSDDKRWLPRLGTNPDASIRMFCVPYAGGGASVYYPWREAVPPRFELCPIQLPGREARADEACIDDFFQMVEVLAPIVGRHLELPYVIYGHSMGAGLAFELARRLARDYGKPPLHLFVGAHRSPNKPYSYPTVQSVSGDQVLKILMRFNGMPRAILENQELLDMFLPILRSDLSVCETYAYEGQLQLDCPITLFTGASDGNVPPHEIAGWEAQTTAHFTHHIIDGDHFFLKSHKEVLLEKMFTSLTCDKDKYPALV
jgi:medium-chain acyl-[acyl-carrier-protein] hydrolase